ncbi:MAG: hypothetical protein KDA97_10025, partial [Acidimicrobiales bacterium]|nr:hypothetical protein [Acidimicrobiales bacterium]
MTEPSTAAAAPAVAVGAHGLDLVGPRGRVALRRATPAVQVVLDGRATWWRPRALEAVDDTLRAA